VRSDTVDFINELRDLNLDLHAVFGRVDTVGCFDGKLAESLENVFALLEITLRGLDE
jgi:hypothetical protein